MAKQKSKIKVINSYALLTEADLSVFESRYSLTLPQDYRRFLLSHNGGSPVQDAFQFKNETGPYTGSSIDKFLGIHTGEDSLEAQYLFCQSEGLLADNLISIADDPGGNRICLSVSGPDTNSVYFWDHEAIDEDDKNANLHLIADCFQEFLDGLQKVPEYVEPEFDRLLRTNDAGGLKTLIASGWDVNTVHAGRHDTATETSAIYAQVEFVRILLENGAKVGRALEIVERCLAMPHLAEIRNYGAVQDLLIAHVNSTR